MSNGTLRPGWVRLGPCFGKGSSTNKTAKGLLTRAPAVSKGRTRLPPSSAGTNAWDRRTKKKKERPNMCNQKTRGLQRHTNGCPSRNYGKKNAGIGTIKKKTRRFKRKEKRKRLPLRQRVVRGAQKSNSDEEKKGGKKKFGKWTPNSVKE